MAESELHKRARQLLRPGDFIGQPIGDPFQIAKINPKAAYDGDTGTKGLQADLVAETTDGQTVHIEFDVTNPISAEKLERLQEAGVYRVLSIKLLPECGGYSDDELRKYIAQGNVFLEGQNQPKTHKWRDLPDLRIFEKRTDSREPLERLSEWQEDMEDLAEHSCFVSGCDKLVMSASDSELREDGDRGLPGNRRRNRKPTRMLPIYSCEDHAFQASLRQLPEGAESWFKRLREHLTGHQP